MENRSFTINGISRDVGIQISGPTKHTCGADLYLKSILTLIDEVDLGSMTEAGQRDFAYQFNVAILKQIINRSFMDTLQRIPEDLDYADALIHDIKHYQEEGLF